MTQIFSFLYFTDEYREEGSERTKDIIAVNIQSACRKFLRWKDKIRRWPICRVDYEVESNGTYIDISDQPSFVNLI